MGVLGVEAAGASTLDRPAGGVGQLEICDRAAAAADHVRVGLHAGVEDDGAAPGPHAADQAELLEQLERGVDRRQRGAGEHVGDGSEHLLGGHMPRLGAECAVDHEALRSHPQTAIAQLADQPFVCRRHGHTTTF